MTSLYVLVNAHHMLAHQSTADAAPVSPAHQNHHSGMHGNGGNQLTSTLYQPFSNSHFTASSDELRNITS